VGDGFLNRSAEWISCGATSIKWGERFSNADRTAAANKKRLISAVLGQWLPK
jgi:hypothetical protein